MKIENKLFLGHCEELSFNEKLVKIDQLFRKKISMDPIVMGQYGDKYFSGNAASLYTLLAEGDDKKLFKIGWGEVSRNTFQEPVEEMREFKEWRPFRNKQQRMNQIKALRQLPTPVYCLRQSDSYFANKKQQELMNNDPEQYLYNWALFVHNNQFIGRNNKLWQNFDKNNQQTPLPVGDTDQLISYLENLYI